MHLVIGKFLVPQTVTHSLQQKALERHNIGAIKSACDTTMKSLGELKKVQETGDITRMKVLSDTVFKNMQLWFKCQELDIGHTPFNYWDGIAYNFLAQMKRNYDKAFQSLCDMRKSYNKVAYQELSDAPKPRST